MSDLRAGVGLEGLLPGAMEDGLKAWFRRGTGAMMLVLVALGWAALMTWSVRDPALAGGPDAFSANMLGQPGALFADLFMQSLGLAAIAALLAPTYWALDRALGTGTPPSAGRIACWPIATMVLAGALSMLPMPDSWPLKRGLGGVLGDLVGDMALQPLAQLGHAMAASLAFVVLAAAGVLLLSRAMGVSLRNRLRLRNRRRDRDSEDLEIGEPFVVREPEHEGHRFDEPARWQAPRTSYSLDDSIEPDAETLPRIVTQRTRTPSTPPSTAPRRGSGLPPVTHEAGTSLAQLHDSLPDDPDSLAMARRFAPAPAGDKGQRPSPADSLEPSALSEPFPYQPPSLLALRKGAEPRKTAEGSEPALRGHARQLEDALAQFGVEARVVRSVPGPIVTIHELETARSVNSRRVLALAEDIAAAMGLASVRVSAIPASDRIGVEVPNGKREVIALRDLMESDGYRREMAVLPLTLGRAMDGEPVIADLARMPHLLVAGAEQSGKSSVAQSLMLSLLYKLSPDRLRVLIIDAATHELSSFAGIPHLIAPPTSDGRQGAQLLSRAASELEERSKRMAQIDAGSIEAYNARIEHARRQGSTLTRTVQTGFDGLSGRARFERATLDLEPMPYIVIMIGELGSLMRAAPEETEAALRQLSRGGQAVGIHVIALTGHMGPGVLSRPVLKALPARLCLRTRSKSESTLILGEQGAEQLLGDGDAVYAMSQGHMVRVHAPMVTDDELDAVVCELARQSPPRGGVRLPEGKPLPERSGAQPRESASRQEAMVELFNRAVEYVRRDRIASPSHLQKQLGIPLETAQELITRMETRRLVSRADSMGKRRVCID